MAGRMTWGRCLEQGIVTRTKKDPERASRMLKMATLRMRFWDGPIKGEFAALKVEAYYDIIKELIFAHLYQSGYNCSNHLCLISYLRETFHHFDEEASRIDSLRKMRNDISYKGLIVSSGYLELNEPEFRHIITELKQRLKS